MTDDEFDAALISAAFEMGAQDGWRKVSAAAAAQRAGLDLVRARARFGHPGMILAGFGRLADLHALTGALAEGDTRERLFDSVLRRFDFLQAHRAGVLALLKILPLEPAWAAYLTRATVQSMGWLLEAAGVSAGGIAGALRKQGLAAVWAWGLRAWMTDETADLSATMAAVDVALTRAEQIAARFSGGGAAAADVDSETFEDPAAAQSELPLAEFSDEPPIT